MIKKLMPILVGIVLMALMPGASAIFGDWDGYAFIIYDGNVSYAPDNLSVATAHLNGSSSVSDSCVIGGNKTSYLSSQYLLQVDFTDGDMVWFKLCGVWVNEPPQNWTPGLHDQFNISINATRICNNSTCPDEYKCEADCACEKGNDSELHCVHNFCRQTEPFIGDGFCDTCDPSTRPCNFSENCVNSPVDCKCQSGYYCSNANGKCVYTPSRGGGGGGGGGSTGSVIAPTVCGDGKCEKLETYDSCPKDCPKPIVCGDGNCEGSEKYETCPNDCPKPVVCGDGACESNETYETCPKDCPKPVVCGDGVCEGNETYKSCPKDCPRPVVCGDGMCDANETCKACASDCGTCPVVCGDGVCDGDEKCDTCASDCNVCPNLVISCSGGVTEGDTVTCRVTDKNGNSVAGAGVMVTMPDGTKKALNTDGNGNVRFTADQSGTITASAGKKEYTNAETKIPVKAKGMPVWYFLIPLLIILLLLLLFLLLRKKKTVAELEFIVKAIAEGKLNAVLDKFKKIYVTPNTYREYKKVAGSAVDERIEEVDLNDKGNEYLDEVKNETVALAMQLKAKTVLTDSLSCKKTAEGKGFKVLNVEEAVE